MAYDALPETALKGLLFRLKYGVEYTTNNYIIIQILINNNNFNIKIKKKLIKKLFISKIISYSDEIKRALYRNTV
jgi:hypothetical protein